MKLFLSYILLIITFTFQGQNTVVDNNEFIKFTHIGGQLSKQWISSIIQDNDGFMWVATQDGLFKYDGSQTLSYRFHPRKKNTLPANWVRVIKQDKNGIFWIGTQGAGLVKFNQETGDFFSLKEEDTYGINSTITYNIFITSKNAIWVVTDDGIYRKPPNTERFKRVYEKSINVFVDEANDGKEIVAIDHTVYEFEKGKLIPLKKNIEPKKISISSENTMIYRLNGKFYTHNFEEDSTLIRLPKDIWGVSNIQNGYCVFLGKEYICKYNLKTNEVELIKYYKNRIFDPNHINAVYYDQQEILWVATQDGLYKENKAGRIFTEVIPTHARRIIPDGDKLYIGGQQGLRLYCKKDKSYKSLINNTQIFSVLKTKEGIWAGDIFGEVHFVDHNQNVKTFSLNKSSDILLKVYGLVEDESHHIWASSWEGLHVLDKQGNELHKFIFDIKELSNELKAVQIYLDKKGNLWVLTVGNGLFRIPKISKISNGEAPFTYTRFQYNREDENSLNSNVLYAVLEDSHGNIWFGSDFGINIFSNKDQSFKALKIDGKLFNKKVMAIEEDQKGMFWISTIKDGIYVYNPNNDHLINFNSKDGLVSDACLFSSSALDGENMYFGTDDGIQIINPNLVINPQVVSSPNITGFEIFGKNTIKEKGKIFNGTTITLDHNQTDLALDFSSHDYRFPDKINYYYRLENAHKDWRKAINNTVTYTNLSSGIYSFNVKSSYQSSISNSPTASFTIKIKKPWYKTIWAIVLFSCIFLSIVLLLVYLKYNQQNAQNKLQLAKEINKAKNILLANISHEFRTPLTLISGPIQNELERKELTKDQRSNFEMIQRNSNRLLSLVDQLLEVSKIETGTTQLSVRQQNIMSFIGSIADGFHYLSQQKDLNYLVYLSNTKQETWFDSDVLEKVVTNLLSNAIKYTPDGGSVVCNACVKDDQLHFSVKNTGKGLTKEEQTKIFERFYQVDTHRDGIGIGLALIKELITLHKGTITVENTPSKWVMFNVIIPISKSRFSDQEINKQPILVPKTESLPPSIYIEDEDVTTTSNNKPILLIVDDNQDIRTYVSTLFNTHYLVLKAKNGKEGIDLAIEHIPDIIISDIMMPIKNGVELCNTLKNDKCTSHIPIILLTAKVGEENKLKGLKTGAEDYISKPFNKELLMVRVEKLIENRKKLQARYSKDVALYPKDITLTSVDEQFLKNLQTVLDKHLVESSFNIEAFSKAVGMSRMQLHRKLKALTGLSASEFIRTQRLKLASELLKKSDVNISQVGYSVGFNDHAYFSKCFKKMYNCTPSEYKNQHHTN